MQESLDPPSRQIAHDSKVWVALFAATLVWLAIILSSEISRPWINGPDFNGVVWSQSAHNILRAGLSETSGASSGFYFGPLPIPPQGYYLHHPPLLHLAIAVLFAVLGEHEWVARLVPVGCSLASAVFLWLLVRSCLGIRVATLSTAVFAFMPMELRYGSMVNFEPCVLMLMLGALWCLRGHRVSGVPGWRYGALAFIVAGLWVDWAMYLFVASLCACWLLRSKDGDRRFAGIICLSGLLSAAVYLLRIAFLQPDALKNLAQIFMFRLGAGKGGHFTELQWITRTADTMVAHFLPVGLILGAIGVAILWRGRTRDEGLQWLGRACLSVLVMDALFVGVFQNDSYIHQYIAYYFLFPLSVAAGLALNGLIDVLQRAKTVLRFRGAAELSVCLLLGVIGVFGLQKTNALVHQFRILDYSTDEPRNLIPDLGQAIQDNFSAETRILCNFLPDYGPHLAYYAQRDIINNLSEYRFWDPHLNDPSKRIGGVVWVSSSASRHILEKLPAGTKRFLTLGGFTFCLWTPRQVSKGK